MAAKIYVDKTTDVAYPVNNGAVDIANPVTVNLEDYIYIGENQTYKEYHRKTKVVFGKEKVVKGEIPKGKI